MKIRYPLAFDLTPKEIDSGQKWLTLKVKNIGKTKLMNLDVQLNSLDSFYINPIDEREYIYELDPNEETKIPFQVKATATTNVYISVESSTDEGHPLFVESPSINVRVGFNPAEIQSMFALSEPYPVPKETIKCESNIIGLKESGELDLEFWAETPTGTFEELATMKTKSIKPGEIAKYSAEITPEDEGLYEIHAYLHDGNRRIDHKTDSLYVKK